MDNILRVSEERMNSIVGSWSLPQLNQLIASDVTLIFRLMMLSALLALLCLVALIFLGSFLYILGSTFGHRNPHLDATVHVMIIAGSGGHTTEVLRLVSGLSDRYYPRTYVVAETDTSSETRIRSFEASSSHSSSSSSSSSAAAPDGVGAVEGPASNNPNSSRGSYKVVKIPRSREVRQSWMTTVFTTLFSIFHSIPLLLNHNPDLVICNGPGTCIPICLMVRFVRMFRILETKILFVESICRVKTLSLSGKILYHLRIADRMVVQWPELKTAYPEVELLEGII